VSVARRVVFELDEDMPPARLADPGAIGAARTAGSDPGRRDAAMRVLVVDPEPAPPGALRLGAAAVANAVRRVGAMPTVSAATDWENMILDHYVVEPHVVVVVLHPEPAPPAPNQPPDPWEAGARLTRALRATGSPVIAVSFGASAMAVAACVEQGAIGLFDIGDLPEELTRLSHGSGTSDSSARRKFPRPYDGLVSLTPAERRVLHLMMRGRSAADIVVELGVSLSTVRTHIRSILRKLHVSSQLTAVAIANGSVPLAESTA
jgi:DNA-binding CsgD family transcriptional regulator